MFVPLHIYSGYNFLKSSILIDKLLLTAKNLNYQTLGISDYQVMHAFPEFYYGCKKQNINPILGIEIKIDNNFYSLFLKDEVGYQNLCYLSTNSLKQENFSFEEIKDKLKGLKCVFKTANKLFLDKIDDNTFKILKNISTYFDEFYLGLEIYNNEDTLKANLIRSFASSYNFKIIAYPEVRYCKKEEAISLKILDAINKQTSFDFNENPAKPYYFLKNQKELEEFYTDEELDNTSLVAQNINFDFDKKRGKLLHYNENSNSDELLINNLKEGLKFRNIDLSLNSKYRNRLNYEYITIKNMGFSDYFLIVQDYVNYAKHNNIPVGPGRGSAAGSLVSYLLGITEVDPLKYNLLFERFLNDQRETMPDIDIDFSDTKRDQVFSYLINKYGENRCARVVTYQTFGAKQALRDVTKAFGFTNSIADKICKTIPNSFNAGNYSLDYAYEKIPAFKETIDSLNDFKTIFKMAHLIEGLPRQTGLHAAGIIIDNNDLNEKIPLFYDLTFGNVTQYEKDYLEKQGFLKMDLLGLSNLRTIENCLIYIKQNRNIDIKINKIPYEEDAIFKLIRNGLTMGLFQLDTSAATQALNYIKPNNFMDVVATISLDRPGPQQQIPTYALRKERKQKVTYLDKCLIPILKETYGIIVYQEQIMQICQAFAGFSFKEADLFRRAISKKDEKQLKKMKDNFKLSALKNNHSNETIDKIFDLILKFANYGFNKSHAICYAIIACQEAYLKAHYGPEFYLAILDQQYGSNDTKFNKYLAEIKRLNIEILLPDINKSDFHFTLESSKLRMPLIGIKEFPSKVVFNIIEERNTKGMFKDFIDFVVRMFQKEDKITSNQLSKLIDAGCFDSLYPNRKSLKLSIPHALQYASTTIYKDGMLFDNFGLEFKYIDTVDDPLERIENEYNAIGVMLSDSPLKHVSLSQYKKLVITKISEIKLNYVCYILVIIRSIKTTQIKNGMSKGQPMAFITVFDESDEIDVTLFPEVYSKHQSELELNNILLIKGKLEYKNNRSSFIAENLKLMR